MNGAKEGMAHGVEGSGLDVEDGALMRLLVVPASSLYLPVVLAVVLAVVLGTWYLTARAANLVWDGPVAPTPTDAPSVPDAC